MSRLYLLKLVWDQLETQPPLGQEFHNGAGVFTTCPFQLQAPGERLRNILIEAPGKVASGVVVTDVFLLPFAMVAGRGWEGKGVPGG